MVSGDGSRVASGDGVDGVSRRGAAGQQGTRVHEDADGVGVPTRHARAWVVAGMVCALGALWLVLPGVLGMLAGSVAHLKGHRAGMPVAVASAFTTVAGMALAFWVS